MVTRKEYLEKLLADSYKKENDGEENVARSLPFFAASLALLAATLGAIRTEAPPLDITRESLVFWILIALIFVAIGFVLFHLYQAVRPRSFKYLSKNLNSSNILFGWKSTIRIALLPDRRSMTPSSGIFEKISSSNTPRRRRIIA
ncbi:hypothetical protein [uncultured Ferrovibrio sp.]|jgi:hypothetical protein|uniref:hypothetical protein n=1 Tax=uncultured Ferrovibrio sp. TaxID=1576913 RepID=UPI00262DE5E1|nr:hypothetical protein [uncultured Ferrovibrio sp.]